MMRALWSAASGMIAQQTNVDTISNNIANVNTTGYKTEKTEFKSLLYQNLQARTTTANGANKPIPAQVGLGTRVASNTSMFTQGAMLAVIRHLRSTAKASLQFVEQMVIHTIQETVILPGASEMTELF